MSTLLFQFSTKLVVTIFLSMCLCASQTEARPSEGLRTQIDVETDIPEPSVEPGNLSEEVEPYFPSLTTPIGAETDIPDPSLYPGNLSLDVVRQIQKCEVDVGTMELCMRCAKVTKSTIVYPMCCDNEDGVKNWCHAYVYYAVSSSSSSSSSSS